MYSSLFQIQKLFEKLRPLIVTFNDDKVGFSESQLDQKKRFKFFLIDLNLCLMVIASTTGLRRVLSSDKDINQTFPAADLTMEQKRIETQQKVLGSVLCILYLTLEIYCLVAACTFTFGTKSTTFMMNQARGLHLDRLKRGQKKPWCSNQKRK